MEDTQNTTQPIDDTEVVEKVEVSETQATNVVPDVADTAPTELPDAPVEVPAVVQTEAVPETISPEATLENTPEAVEKGDEVKQVEDKSLDKLKSLSDSQVMSDEDSLDTEQMVVFKLEKEDYAIPILDVQEIIPTSDITPFPNVASYIAGIINVRGTVATVINLADRFNLNRTKDVGVDRYIILTNIEKALFGVMVDEVTSVMKIPTNRIREAAGGGEGKIAKDYVSGVAVMDDSVILILDFKKILLDETLMNFAQANI